MEIHITLDLIVSGARRAAGHADAARGKQSATGLIDFRACGNMAVATHAERKIVAGFRPRDAGRRQGEVIDV
jgi:hypothetical protein